MYVTVAEYQAYATSVGKTLPATEAEQTQQLLKASHFIDVNEQSFMGIRTERDQSYSFPRYGFVYKGYSYDSDEVPADVERCQMELALDINDGIDIFDREYSKQVTRETVGPITVEYTDPTTSSIRRKQSLGIMLLNGLMQSLNMSLRLTRV